MNKLLRLFCDYFRTAYYLNKRVNRQSEILVGFIDIISVLVKQINDLEMRVAELEKEADDASK